LRTLRWLAVPAVALALFSVACGGDDNGGEDSEATETSTTTSTATSETTTEATATESSGEGEEVDLASVFAGFGEATFNITYRMDGGAEGESIAGDWKWIQDAGGERTRFEAESEGQTVVMITTPEQTLVCSQDTCFDAGGAMGGAVPDIGDMFTENIDDVQAEASTGTVRKIDGREIAGTDTECVEFEDEAEGVNGVACYAEGGIPLFVESTTADGTFRMEAIEFSTDVSDADFEAPFPVMSLGG